MLRIMMTPCRLVHSPQRGRFARYKEEITSIASSAFQLFLSAKAQHTHTERLRLKGPASASPTDDPALYSRLRCS